MVSSEFANTLIDLKPLLPHISQMMPPPSSWHLSDFVVIEVPMLEFSKSEVHLAVQRLMIASKQQLLNALLVVTPRAPSSAQGRHQLTALQGAHSALRPVRRWNEWISCPFQLFEVCSCIARAGGGGVHHRFQVGATLDLFGDGAVCDQPAVHSSFASTAADVQQGLCGIISYASRVLDGAS